KTGEHDVETKIQQARKFLEHNDKVQVNVLFRGREMQHIEEGQRVMNQVLEALQNDCKIESPARMEGKRMVALLAPKPGAQPGGAPQAARGPQAGRREAQPQRPAPGQAGGGQARRPGRQAAQARLAAQADRLNRLPFPAGTPRIIAYRTECRSEPGTAP